MAEYYCELCNSEVPQGALACPVCGTPVSKPAQANAGVSPADVPAAPPEYIDLAEVTVPSEQAPAAPQIPAEESPFGEETPADIGSVADQSIAPGILIPPESVQLTNEHTGGYKEAAAGPSVAGAGAQTADDPFGLKITETAPVISSAEEEGFNFNNLKNIVMLIFSFLIIAGVTALGVWYFVIRKPAPKVASPQSSIENTLVKVFSGSLSGIENYADPNCEFVAKANTVFAPYRELGMLTLSDFETETEITGNVAMVTITKLNVKLTSESGDEMLDILSVTKPYPFPTVIKLEKRNNKWIIVS